MSYIEETYETTKEQFELAKDGLVHKLNKIGETLSHCDTYAYACELAAVVAKNVCAVKDLEDRYMEAKQRLDKEREGNDNA